MRVKNLTLAELEERVITIGFVDENLYTQVRIDCKELFDEHPDAIPSLAVQPPQGDAYPAVVTREGDIVVWNVAKSDVQYANLGRLQLTFVIGEIVAKSYVGKFVIDKSLMPDGEAPTPIENWITEANAVLGEIPGTIAEAVDDALEEAKESGEFDGADGVSPTVTVTKTKDGHNVVITDAEGDHSFNVPDGTEGKDGVTPQFGIGTVSEGHTADVTMTGTKENPVLNFVMPKVTTEDIVAVQDTQPTAEETAIWFPETPPTPVQVPTYAEHMELKEDVDSKVADVKYKGTSLVDQNGVAQIPPAQTSTPGLAMVGAGYGLKAADPNGNSAGRLSTDAATSSHIRFFTDQYRPITPYYLPEAVFRGLAQVAGDDTQTDSQNPVGTYTEDAKEAIQEMLNVPDATENETAHAALMTEITNAQEDITDVKNAFETAMDGISEQGGEITGGIIAFDKTGKTISQIAISDTSVTSANITRCGKNIIPKFSSGTGGSNLSWTVASDGTITFSGSSTSDVFLRLYNQNIPCKSGEKKTVAFFNNMADSNNRLSFFGVTTAGNLQVNLNSVNKINTVTHGANAQITELRLRIPKDVDWTGLIIKPMMVVGDVAGDFEEYNGQTYSVNVSDGVVQGGSIIYLDGVNTMWSSVGDITVTYDQTGNIKKYVDDQFADASLFPSFYKYVQRTYSSGTQKYLYVYNKSGNKVVQWTLMNISKSGSNSDTWQIGGVKGYDFDGSTLSNEVELAMNGEFELAIKEHGAEDYCGGVNHGDENTDVFKLFIDGKQISDLTTLDENFHAFNRIDAFEIATINRCNTPSQDIITHQKIWTFENGKVRVHQTCKFLEQIQVDVMMVCMFKAVRSVYPYGIRQGSVDIETMTDATFTKKYTTGNDAYYLYYGDNATAKIHASTDNDGSVRQSVLWINNASDSNKLYLGYWGINDSANPVTVPANTIVTEETEYDAAFD